jgi:beta-aspartyl-peptidase (threonine type)
MTPENEARFRAGIERALAAGQEVLSQGRSSLEAVVAAVKVMEDDPQFNAGRGAVFTNAGRNELDASVMDGDTGQAGAVAGVTVVKNPIDAAVAVMRRTRHVLLSGAGADEFARQSGLEIVDPSYFHTPHRWEQLQRARERDRIELDHDARRRTSERPTAGKAVAEGIVDDKYGTVGAVAIDAQGRLAAATSTGGLTNKLFGRVGDSPIVGAGTFADKTVAVSSTGTGEFFIRGAVAHDVSARLRYLRVPLGEAVGGTLQSTLSDRGGRGGVIALDAQGNVVMGFNTEGMYRGYRREGGESVVQIYRD